MFNKTIITITSGMCIEIYAFEEPSQVWTWELICSRTVIRTGAKKFQVDHQDSNKNIRA